MLDNCTISSLVDYTTNTSTSRITLVYVFLSDSKNAVYN